MHDERPTHIDGVATRLAVVDGTDGTDAGILVWAYAVGRQLDAWLTDALDGTGLATSDYVALAGVTFARPGHLLSAGELSTWLVQTSGGATKTLQRLVDRGLVRRVADPDDGRRTLIEATSPGRRTAERVAVDLLARLDGDLTGLDDTRRRLVLEALRDLSSALDP